MNAEQWREQMGQHRLMAVIRTASASEALTKSHRVLDAGVGVLEVTWTTPDAASVLEALQDRPATLGAGTILTPEQAREAVDHGAKFLVGPNFSEEVAETASRLDTLYVPGVYTAGEAARAMAQGLTILKLFPAASGGPAHLKMLRDPFPALWWVPTGGVSWHNASEWLAAGAIGVGMGSALFDTADLRSAVGHLRSSRT